MDPDSNHVNTQREEFSFLDKTLLSKDLICNICSRLLNVTPIMFSESIGNICGRCSAASMSFSNLGGVLRQTTFEELIKNLTFPCTNKEHGCDEVLEFDKVQSHERNCRFQCTSCPLFYHQVFSDERCSWSGNSSILCDHLRVHQDKFLNPPQFEWPQLKQNVIFFTDVGNQVMTVVIKHEKAAKYLCLVMVNGTDIESQCFRYQLELADEDKSNSLILRRNRLLPLSDLMDGLHCPEKALEVDVEKVSQMLQNPKKILAKVGIVKKIKKEIIQITGTKDGEVLSNGTTIKLGKEKNAPPDEDMLTELECPVCNEFMIPPIFICATGHSVCGDCKDMVQVCPTCRSHFAEGRNFTLEKLTLKVKYPCRNREIGCGFVTTSDKIKQHQGNCELSEKLCILKCGWKGLAPGLYNHFLDAHPAQLLQNNVAVVKDLRQDKNNVGRYFIYVMGELFCLSSKNCGKNTVKFNVQYVGCMDTESQYKYTAQFSSVPDATCPVLSVTNLCQTSNDNLSDSLGPGCVTIPGDFLKSYLFQNHLYYFKVNITKV